MFLQSLRRIKERSRSIQRWISLRTFFASANLAAAFVAALVAMDRTTAETTSLSGAQYASLCQSRGVPLPPRWGTSAWRFKGALTDAQEFILRDRIAHVYYYESDSPPGLCIALPRTTASREMVPGEVPGASFGVICQGESGSVCFWDNAAPVDWDPRNGTTVFSEQKTIASTDAGELDGTFIGGAALASHPGGMCTDCHAGENPFIIHPDTAVDLGSALQVSDFWYDPIVPSGWPENPGPINSPGACAVCHVTGGPGGRFPAISGTELPQYCSVVLPNAINRTMPPGAGGSLAGDPHSTALLAMCNQPVFDVPPTPPADTELTVMIGETVEFDVQATDPNPEDDVFLEVIELPAGARFEPTDGNPAVGTFSWTPTANQEGTHVLTFTATDSSDLAAAPHEIVIQVERRPKDQGR